MEPGVRMIVVSEARDGDSHDLILADLRGAEAATRPADTGDGRLLHSEAIEFPMLSP